MSDAAAPVYLYGVIRDRGGARVLDVSPISGAGLVYTIAHRGLAAVVSDDPLPRYAVSRKNVRGHEAVVETAMAMGDILPARLGTVVASAGAVVEDLLERRWAELGRLLDRVSGCVEFGVKASWPDLRRVFHEIVAGDRELRARRDRLAANPGAATYEARIDLGDRASRLLEAKRRQEADDLAAALEAQAAGVRRAGPISELMVLNAAFLVTRAGTEAFEAAVREADRGQGGRLVFRLAGPLPPYNFVGFSGP